MHAIALPATQPPANPDTENKPAQQTIMEEAKSEQVGIATAMPAAQMERKKINFKSMAQMTIAQNRMNTTTTSSSSPSSGYTCATASDIAALASILRHRPPVRLYTVGVLVRHEKHGVGEVIETREDDGYVVVVSYDSVGGDGSTHSYNTGSHHKLHVIDKAAWDSIVDMAVATAVSFHSKPSEKKQRQPGHTQEKANKRPCLATLRAWVGQLERRLSATVEGVRRSWGTLRKSSLGFIISSVFGAMAIMVGIQMLAVLVWPSCTPGVPCKHKRSREHQHTRLPLYELPSCAHTTHTQCTHTQSHTNTPDPTHTYTNHRQCTRHAHAVHRRAQNVVRTTPYAYPIRV